MENDLPTSVQIGLLVFLGLFLCGALAAMAWDGREKDKAERRHRRESR